MGGRRPNPFGLIGAAPNGENRALRGETIGGALGGETIGGALTVEEANGRDVTGY